MRKIFPVFILIIALLSSCKTAIQAQKNNQGQSVSVNSTGMAEQEIQFNKILKDFTDNKWTETEANEAYLLAKSYEFNNKLDKAEKLLDIEYKFSPNTTVAMNLIQIKIALKKTTDAKEIAKHAHVVFPNDADIFLTLIQIYQIENNILQVNNLLDDGHKKFPRNEQIAILYAFYNKKNSKRILENFIIQNPNSPNALLRLSSLFYQEKKYAEALKYAKKSSFYDPDNIDAIVSIAKINENLKNYPDAEKFYKSAFEKDMENNINAQNYINILLFQKKQQEALSILLKLEASSDVNLPFPPEFTFEIGRILIINEDYRGAKKKFESLLDSQYASIIDQNEVLFFLAYSCENLHLFNEANKHLESIKPTSKIFSSVKREKIFLAINSKKNEVALELIKNFQIDPNFFIEDTLFKSSILLFFNRNDEAIELLNQSIKTKPLEKDLYLKRIEAYLHMDKNIEFIIHEAKYVVKKWPNYADGLNFLGYILVDNSKNAHQLKYAEKILKKALSTDTKNPYYLDSLGYLYLKKNNLVLAQKYFIDSLKYMPNEPVILYHYAQVLKLLHNSQEAEKNLEKARIIISNMLIYSLESDDELKKIAASLQHGR